MSLERIEVTPFAVIVGDILQNRRTGQLTIVRAPLRKELYWSQGELVLIHSSAPEESLGEFLVRRVAIPGDRAAQLHTEDPAHVVSAFHESGLFELSARQTLLREWMSMQFLPLFSLDEGTAAFTDDEALAPDKRVFLQSTAALVLEGIRAITNGLVLRRSLGDLKREIAPARDGRHSLDSIPLTDLERRIAAALTDTMTIETFLRHFANESVVAAKVVIGMLALGVYATVDYRDRPEQVGNVDDMQRDLEMLAAIGSGDQRSLRVVALSRQMVALDHYKFLDVARGATRSQILSSAEAMKRRYDAATFPPIVREPIQAIQRRIDESLMVLKDAHRRAEYDKLLAQGGARSDGVAIQQRLTQRAIAEQNYLRAKEMTIEGDYYGAILLLKQAVQYIPEHAESWYLLASCQERNPKWRREAAESLQRALSINPEYVDALVSLGDLYKSEGLASRAQSCYEDVLKFAPDNQQAKSRLAALRKK